MASGDANDLHDAWISPGSTVPLAGGDFDLGFDVCGVHYRFLSYRGAANRLRRARVHVEAEGLVAIGLGLVFVPCRDSGGTGAEPKLGGMGSGTVLGVPIVGPPGDNCALIAALATVDGGGVDPPETSDPDLGSYARYVYWVHRLNGSGTRVVGRSTGEVPGGTVVDCEPSTAGCAA